MADDKPATGYYAQAVELLKKAKEYLSYSSNTAPIPAATAKTMIEHANNMYLVEHGNFMSAMLNGDENKGIPKFPDKIIQQLDNVSAGTLKDKRDPLVHGIKIGPPKGVFQATPDMIQECREKARAVLSNIDTTTLDHRQRDCLERYKLFVDSQPGPFTEADLSDPIKRKSIIRAASAFAEGTAVTGAIDKSKQEIPKIQNGRRLTDDELRRKVSEPVPEASRRNVFMHDYSRTEGLALPSEVAANNGRDLIKEYEARAKAENKGNPTIGIFLKVNNQPGAAPHAPAIPENSGNTHNPEENPARNQQPKPTTNPEPQKPGHPNFKKAGAALVVATAGLADPAAAFESPDLKPPPQPIPEVRFEKPPAHINNSGVTPAQRNTPPAEPIPVKPQPVPTNSEIPRKTGAPPTEPAPVHTPEPQPKDLYKPTTSTSASPSTASKIDQGLTGTVSVVLGAKSAIEGIRDGDSVRTGLGVTNTVAGVAQAGEFGAKLLPTVAKYAGKLAVPLQVADGVYQISQENSTGDKVGKAIEVTVVAGVAYLATGALMVAGAPATVTLIGVAGAVAVTGAAAHELIDITRSTFDGAYDGARKQILQQGSTTPSADKPFQTDQNGLAIMGPTQHKELHDILFADQESKDLANQMSKRIPGIPNYKDPEFIKGQLDKYEKTIQDDPRLFGAAGAKQSEIIKRGNYNIAVAQSKGYEQHFEKWEETHPNPASRERFSKMVKAVEHNITDLKIYDGNAVFTIAPNTSEEEVALIRKAFKLPNDAVVIDNHIVTKSNDVTNSAVVAVNEADNRAAAARIVENNVTNIEVKNGFSIITIDPKASAKDIATIKQALDIPGDQKPIDNQLFVPNNELVTRLAATKASPASKEESKAATNNTKSEPPINDKKPTVDLKPESEQKLSEVAKDFQNQIDGKPQLADNGIKTSPTVKVTTEADKSQGRDSGVGITL